MTPEEKAAADKAAADKAVADKAAADKAAADAEKAARDRAAAEAKAPVPPFVFSGRRAGGAFGIVGEKFGSSGSLTIGGRPIATSLWTDKDIRGTLPADLLPGDVVLTGATGVVQKGVWPQPHPKPVVTTTTVTIEPPAPK